MSPQEIITLDTPPEQFINHARFLPTTKEQFARLKEMFSENPPAPIGLSKKEYNILLSSNKEAIEHRKHMIREARNRIDEASVNFLEAGLESMIAYEKNLKARIGTIGKTFDTTPLLRAKQVPIDSLIEVRNGFARCPLHNDKTPSVKYYKSENRWHCFSCGAHGDSVDLVMAIDGVSMPDAIKKLVGA